MKRNHRMLRTSLKESLDLPFLVARLLHYLALAYRSVVAGCTTVFVSGPRQKEDRIRLAARRFVYFQSEVVVRKHVHVNSPNDAQ
jgi:hypothetical protein